MGFHSLTTTTHPPNVNLPSSGQQSTARLSAHKRSFSSWGTGPKTPWSETLHKNWCQCVWGVAPSFISVNTHQQINLHLPASSFLAGHLNDTSLHHLPDLLGVCLINRDRGADLGKAALSTQRPSSWVNLCPGRRPLLCPIGEIPIRLWGLPIKWLWL